MNKVSSDFSPMVLHWRKALPLLCGGLAASILASSAASQGESICKTPTAGFDCSPLELEDALAPTTLAQQPITTPEGSTSSPTSELNPDSEEVLEQQAREGNREALAKQAQNPKTPTIEIIIKEEIRMFK